MSGRRQSSLSCSRIARRRHRSTPPSVHEHRQVMCYQQVDADYPPTESARSFEYPACYGITTNSIPGVITYGWNKCERRDREGQSE
ncbi:hypothetical protein CgunFtcFv8_010248 [Champsocephalus gunnari]|uniref:Uncharacterized protein n=1 Tax=Champsocephalus gunnari TaxID=52237 RepID=A0AAN8HZA5_CHAGU|nr:hypothetical protein CgunFtcFv8_010248 [Champsocephalus gunnari]